MIDILTLILLVLGLIIMYVWVHSIVIVMKKIENVTTYEGVILILSLVFSFFYYLGTIGM